MSYHYEQNNDVIVFPDERNFLLARVAYLEYQATHSSVGFVDFIKNRLYAEGLFQVESAHGRSAAPSTPIVPLSKSDADTLFNTSIDPAVPYSDTTAYATILNAVQVPFINIPPPVNMDTNTLSIPFNASNEGANTRSFWTGTSVFAATPFWATTLNMPVSASPSGQPPPHLPPAESPKKAEDNKNNDEGFDNPFELLDMGEE